MWRKTALQYGVEPWAFSEDFEHSVNTLVEINKGAATWWGIWQREERVWSGVAVIPGVPLNIYASPNPRIAKDCSKSTDVFFVRTLFVDIENVTVAPALAKLAVTGLPRPSMIVVSGHGIHFYWRLNEPIIDLALWTSFQKRLIQLLCADQAAHDPARLMRLPGFMNVNKNAPSYIYEADPGRRFDLVDIERHLPSLPPTLPMEVKPTSKGLSVSGEAATSFSSTVSNRLLRASAYTTSRSVARHSRPVVRRLIEGR
jgi:hypothetical protein